MGYRSDVMIKLPQENWEQYKTLVIKKCEEYCKDNNEGFSEEYIFYKATIIENNEERFCVPFVSIYFGCRKWYSSFSEVRAIQDSLYEMHEEIGMSYSFARSGEENGDIEEEHEDGEKENEGKDVPWVDVCITLE